MENRDDSRSRSRSRDRRSNHDNDESHNVAETRRAPREERTESRTHNSGVDGGNNLYITNLSFQVTEYLLYCTAVPNFTTTTSTASIM